MNCPDTLYHATFQSFVASIMQQGLKPSEEGQNYVNPPDDSGPYIYLANDPDLAYSFAEESENELIPDDEPIVVLQIDLSDGQKKFLDFDRNIINASEEIGCYQLPCVIPPECLSIYYS